MAGNLQRLLAEVRSIYLPADGPAAADQDHGQIPYPGLVDPPAVGAADEELIEAVMALLLEIAEATQRASALPSPPPTIAYGVLSGSELMMRWECLAGRGGELLGLLHGFTYLATVFSLDRKLALRRSEEVRELVEAAGYQAR